MISRETWEAIKWWELRRIPYTVVIAASGISSYFAANSIIKNYAQDAEDYLNSSVLLIGVPFLIIAANICYTFAWIIFEHAFGKNYREGTDQRLRTIAFYLGLGFSVVVMSLPVWTALLHWLRSTS